ncbi:MAG: hypothetical protein AB8B80_15625 [Marinicellaceae bacterium]
MSSVPEHLWRFWTKDSMESLAEKFQLPYDISDQDWPWQVSDSTRLTEFIKSYKHDGLTDDEKFTLMDLILQSFEDLDSVEDLQENKRWLEINEILNQNIELHIYTVWYWADGYDFRISPLLTEILKRHKRKFMLIPKKIGSIEFLMTAVIDKTCIHTKNCSHKHNNKILGKAKWAAITKADTNGSCYLFMGYPNEELSDTLHESIEDAKEQAEWEYEGISNNWQNT